MSQVATGGGSRSGSRTARRWNSAAIRRDCRRALERSPNSPIAHLNLGRILLETGQADEAVEHLGEALRLDPTDATANYDWGYILQRRERPQEAARHYRRAVELDSEFIPAMLGLASLCIANVRADSAPFPPRDA